MKRADIQKDPTEDPSNVDPSPQATQTEIDDADNESVFYKIELIGFQVGQRLIEKIVFTTPPSNQLPWKPEQIDIVKFLCKEFWIFVFGKSIDNLKTNHRGIYVLQDSNFSWISRFSVDSTSPSTAKMAILVTHFL